LDQASIRWYCLWDNPFIHTSVIFRRDASLQAGGFDATADPFSQDYALWSRMLASGAAGNLSDRLIHYRISASSITGPMNLPEHAATDRRREAFVPILTDIVARNLRATFGPAAIHDSDVALAVGFVTGVPAAQVPAFLKLFFSLLDQYHLALDSETTSTMRRTVARQLDTLAYRVPDGNRRTAAAIYMAAVRHDAGLVRELPWPRALALMTVGATGRGAVKRSSIFRRFVAGRL
jgi:hypothetical protein